MVKANVKLAQNAGACEAFACAAKGVEEGAGATRARDAALRLARDGAEALIPCTMIAACSAPRKRLPGARTPKESPSREDVRCRPGNPLATSSPILVLLASFWGCVGLNRFSIGLIFPLIVPEFQSRGLAGGAPDLGHLGDLGGLELDRRVPLRSARPPPDLAAGRRLRRRDDGRDGRRVELPFHVRRARSPRHRRRCRLVGRPGDDQRGDGTFAQEASTRRSSPSATRSSASGVGSIIITRLTSLWGWRLVFPIIGAATALILVALIVVLREPPKRETQRTDWRRALQLLRDPSAGRRHVAGCAVLTWLQIFVGFNPFFLTKIRAFSFAETGTIASIWGFSGAAGQIVLPLASDRLGRRPVVFASAVASAAALALYILGGYDVWPMRRPRRHLRLLRVRPPAHRARDLRERDCLRRNSRRGPRHDQFLRRARRHHAHAARRRRAL